MKSLNHFKGDLLGRVPDVDVKVPGSAIQIKTDTKVAKLKQSMIMYISRLNQYD